MFKLHVYLAEKVEHKKWRSVVAGKMHVEAVILDLKFTSSFNRV